MRTQALVLKNRLLGSGGTASGVLGGIGSIHNVCHSLCVTVVSILAIFGITTQILPLMFLQTYQMYFWWAALVFTIASAYFYLKIRYPMTRDRNLLIINTGLLIFGLPFAQLADFTDFLRFIGGSVAVIGLFLFIFGKKFNLVYRPVVPLKESQTKASEAITQIAGGSSTIQLPKLTIQSGLFAVVIGGFLINQYFMYQMGIFDKMGTKLGTTATSAMKPLSQMKLSLFDVALAKERMDKNNDGICDVCGMSIDQCISSGQLDCNMGNNNANTIGVLGSQHIHADWKIYINGNALDSTFFEPLAMDMSNPNKQTTSSFIHVDKGAPAPEKTGDLVHMHAKNVPLWVFFRSVGMNLTKDSLTLADGKVYKNENGNNLKFYLNGQKVDELDNYSFQDLDKLLISYGPEGDSDIEKQLSSITNFAKDH